MHKIFTEHFYVNIILFVAQSLSQISLLYAEMSLLYIRLTLYREIQNCCNCGYLLNYRSLKLTCHC